MVLCLLKRDQPYTRLKSSMRRFCGQRDNTHQAAYKAETSLQPPLPAPRQKNGLSPSSSEALCLPAQSQSLRGLLSARRQPRAELLFCGLDLGLSLRAARGPPLKKSPPPVWAQLREEAGASPPPLTNEREVMVSYLAGKSQC